MKIAIIGVGAVGGYFGARLYNAGYDVTFFSRGKALHELRNNGLKLISPKGNLNFPKIPVTDNYNESVKYDYIILGIKAWQIQESANLITPLVGNNTTILPLQNGVEAADELNEKHSGKVLGGLCRIAAYKSAPNEITHADVEPTIIFGELNNINSERLIRLREIFQAAEISNSIPDNIISSLWEKFLFITPVSGIGAVTRCPLGITRNLNETREMLQNAMMEIISISRAKNIFMDENIIEKTFSFLDSMSESTTASMQRDIMEGRPSELEYLNGAVVRLSKGLGITTPVNKFIYSVLLPMEIKARNSIRA